MASRCRPRMYAWGNGSKGQLGTGSMQDARANCRNLLTFRCKRVMITLHLASSSRLARWLAVPGSRDATIHHLPDGCLERGSRRGALRLPHRRHKQTKESCCRPSEVVSASPGAMPLVAASASAVASPMAPLGPETSSKNLEPRSSSLRSASSSKTPRR